MDVISRLLQDVPLPRLLPVRQLFDASQLSDVGEQVTAAIFDQGAADRIRAGQEIAIAVGSRGIANLPEMVRSVVDAVKQRGAIPFIVPAMGSHGGASSEGQYNLLHHLGVNETSIGAPIRSSMEVKELGTTEHGLPVYVDRHASEADGIIVINRIKPHTSFHGKVESGLLKMLAIGLGKQKGAATAHALGFAHMSDHIWDISTFMIKRLPILFGIAVLENGYDQTAKVEAIPAEEIQNREPQLLEIARRWMPKILLNPLDVLIVDEIGKDISGVGMDPNVTGRFPNSLVSGELSVSKIAVLRLTEKTDGNGAGIGLADVTTKAVEMKIDRMKGYANSLTSTTMTTVKLPMVVANDRLAIQAALKTSNCRDLSKARVVRIQNTLHVDTIWISESLVQEASGRTDLEILGEAVDLQFDSKGNLF